MENPVQLNNSNLSLVSSEAHPPSYDRTPSNRIVHMSLGGFHRAHHAYYLDNLKRASENGWTISAVGMMPSDKDKIEQLRNQDGLYSLLIRSAEENQLQVIGSISDVWLATEQQAEVLDLLASADTKILSLTVTEKGYCYDEDGNLDTKHPMIVADLANPSAPTSALGYITEGLRRRRESGTTPYTVVSCDNLPTNGVLTRKLVLQFAAEVDPELAAWIDQNVAFPNSMVDRITPVTTQPIIDLITNEYRVSDAYPVMCEDFIQWVLEDKFCNDRPAYEEVGVQVVADAVPYEHMKVRLLNGSHSMLAYMSYLMGYRAVDDAMADPLIRDFVASYMETEVMPAVPEVEGVDLVEYQQTLVTRFANPAISDQIQRLAEDGSTKIPNAVLPCLRKQLETGGSTSHIVFAFACWFTYLKGKDEQGQPIEITDPKAEEMAAALMGDDPVKGLLSIESIFGNDLVSNEALVTGLSEEMEAIAAEGAKTRLEKLLAG